LLDVPGGGGDGGVEDRRVPADGRGDCWTAAVEGDGHEIEPEGLLEHFAGEVAGRPESGMGVAVLARAGFHSVVPRNSLKFAATPCDSLQRKLYPLAPTH